jgi:hypothetical protein
MSLLTPLRQSSASASTFSLALRRASTSSNAPRTVAASSVQRADEQLALRQKQQATLRRSGRQMDIMSASIQVLGMYLQLCLQREVGLMMCRINSRTSLSAKLDFQERIHSIPDRSSKEILGRNKSFVRRAGASLTVMALMVDYFRCVNEEQHLLNLANRPSKALGC